MNPVFFIGIFLAGAILWLLLSFLYKPVGWIGKRLASDAKKAILEENEDKKENEKEKGED